MWGSSKPTHRAIYFSHMWGSSNLTQREIYATVFELRGTSHTEKYTVCMSGSSDLTHKKFTVFVWEVPRTSYTEKVRSMWERRTSHIKIDCLCTWGSWSITHTDIYNLVCEVRGTSHREIYVFFMWGSWNLTTDKRCYSYLCEVRTIHTYNTVHLCLCEVRQSSHTELHFCLCEIPRSSPTDCVYILLHPSVSPGRSRLSFCSLGLLL